MSSASQRRRLTPLPDWQEYEMTTKAIAGPTLARQESNRVPRGPGGLLHSNHEASAYA